MALPEKLRELKNRAAVLKAAATRVDGAITDPVDVDKLKPLLSDLRNAYANVASAIDEVGENVIDFGLFFQSIAQSVINAQKGLDLASRDYLDRLKTPGHEHAIPSVFKIPKVSADMKFAFERVDSTAVNLIFYGTKEQKKELHQQSVQFDIVAVPPPHEVAPAMQDVASLKYLRLVQDPGDRQKIATILGKIDEATRKKALMNVLLDDDRLADRVIVGSGQQDEYFLAYAKNDPDAKNLGIWFLKVTKKGNSNELVGDITVVYRYGVKPPGNEEPSSLQKLINDFADQQEMYFISFR